MYTCRYDKHNHTFTIMDTTKKKGVSLLMIGDEMASFLQELVRQANEKVLDKDSEEAHV